MSLVELLTMNGGDSRTGHLEKIFGVVVGIVEDIRDPLNLGRVRVGFPWLAEATEAVQDPKQKKEKAISYWARVATLMAGKGRGSYFVPEVGDEVLVAFEHGDVNRPMIIGCLWNVEDKPPEKMDGEGKNDIRSIHSRSGHMIILNDSEDKPSITVVDKTGKNSIFIDSANNAMEIKVEGDLKIDVGGNISISAKGKIDLKADQDLAAETKANLKLKATGNGDLETTGPLNVKSDAKVAIDGTGQAQIKAATVQVNGSGMTEVKGGLVKIN